MNIYLAGGALALLLWPKKPRVLTEDEIAEQSGTDPANPSALGTFARGDVVDVGDNFDVQYFPSRRYQP
jgi:hypothetical protein